MKLLKFNLDCNICGKYDRVVSFYLKDKARRKTSWGFHTDCHIYICEECAGKIKDKFNEFTQSKT